MTKEMKLSILERVHLLNVIPRKGSILENKVIRKLLEKIEFDGKELKEIGLTQDPETNNIRWDADKATIIDVVIEDAEKDIIIKAFKELDNKKEMPLNLLDLYEKFE